MTNPDDHLIVQNYAAAFIDLLGQRAALEGCGLAPNSKEEFIKIAKQSVGAIQNLHCQFNHFYSAINQGPDSSRVRPEHRELHLRMKRTQLKFQRFSDGLFSYISLVADANHLPINGIYGLISSCGALCFLGLASGQPIRGGLDIAWGVELNQNELYGCVVARSYQLESEAAKFPRIVLGNEMMNYLHQYASMPGQELEVQYVRAMATACLEMIHQDIEDGLFCIDYLGEKFRQYIGSTVDNQIFHDARTFIREQLDLFQSVDDKKLFDRYKILDRYFESRQYVWPQ